MRALFASRSSCLASSILCFRLLRSLACIVVTRFVTSAMTGQSQAIVFLTCNTKTRAWIANSVPPLVEMCSSLQSEWPLYHYRNVNDSGSGCKYRNALSVVQLTPSQAVSEFQSSHLSEIVCVCLESLPNKEGGRERVHCTLSQ